MPLTAVIVQARMSSSRLPGKVLLDLGDKPVLDRVITRCRLIAGVDVVCIAVPEARDSDPVADLALACGAGCIGDLNSTCSSATAGPRRH